ARHSDVRLTLGRYAHSGLFDLAAAVNSLPSMLPPGRKDEATVLPATGTDREPERLTPRGRKKKLCPNLCPRPSTSGDELRQAEIETRGSKEVENSEGIAVSANSRGKEGERPLPDSNRGWRICNPLPYRLAKGPDEVF